MKTPLPIGLISTDFDGTLHADHEDPPVPADLQAILASLQAQGARWVINTGRDLAGLLSTMGKGILITGFTGGNSNPATGAFSLGIRGQWIQKYFYWM